MFEISSKKVNFEKENTIIKRNINLWENLDCFVLISTNKANLGDLMINNILDSFVDKITKENDYNDFSLALENINAIIKTWEWELEEKPELDVVIWLLNNNNFIFSNIWNSSCYLINNQNNISELTNKNDKKEVFSYVSSWELKNGDIIVSSTKRLLDYLSKSDFLDGLVLSENIKIFNKNIKNILLSEILEDNILVSSLKYVSKNQNKKETSNNIDIIKNHFLKSIDNNFFKNIIWYYLVLKDKLNASSKIIKNVAFLSWMIVSIIFLYSILSSVIWITTQTEHKETNKENIFKAETFRKIASENIANPEIFRENIKFAEQLLDEVKENEIYLNDIEEITNEIWVLKKQFNKIEIFRFSKENTIYADELKNSVKIIKNNKKTYIVTNKWVIWPIIPNIKAEKFTFNSLEQEENFIDATFIWTNMYLITNLSKVVRFTKNWYFSYSDVAGQKTWEKSKEILSYSQNIYLVWENEDQIYKHGLYWSSFKVATPYFKKDDITQMWEILSVAIDWWFYILKKDLSMVKFFSNPYRIEKLIINKLPKNYDLDDKHSIIDLKARSDLNYVYMLLNNKIWVFLPNTKNYKNTKSLTYLWQIEAENYIIKDFFINHDWEILILNEKWIYKITFEISDDRLLIR
jgi:hypothetical protein